MELHVYRSKGVECFEDETNSLQTKEPLGHFNCLKMAQFDNIKTLPTDVVYLLLLNRSVISHYWHARKA